MTLAINDSARSERLEERRMSERKKWKRREPENLKIPKNNFSDPHKLNLVVVESDSKVS